MPPDAPAGTLDTLAKWSGPALIAIGFVAIAIAALSPVQESPLARWVLNETLAPAQILPLIGLGAAFACVSTRAFATAFILFAAGIALGLIAEYWLLWALDTIPGAATHAFLTGPLSYLAAGVSLVAAVRWQTAVVPAAGIVIGALLALTTRLTDPSLHELAYTALPLLIASWLVGALSLTLRAFRRGWFAVFARILGSWLIAVGILYGAVSLLPPKGP
jgi:hypothetical protein